MERAGEAITLIENLPVLVRFMITLTIFLVVPTVSKRLKIPGLVGLILVGIILGQSGFGIARHNAPVLEMFAEVGKLLLLFYVGLEIDMKQFQKDIWRELSFGMATFLLPLAAGTWIGLLFGYNTVSAVLIGSLLASHTLLGYPIVQRLGLVSRPATVITIGATIFTDIMALLVLAICVSVHLTGSGGLGIAVQIVELMVYIAVVLFGLDWVAQWILRRFPDETDFHMLVLLLIVAVSSLLAELINLEPIVGAFLAGLAVNRALKGTKAKEHVEVLGNTLFVPAFFLSIGLLLDVPAVAQAIMQNWGLVLGINVALIASKFLAAWLTGWLFRFSRDERMVVWSLTLPQVAATLAAALVAFQTINAAGARLIDDRVLSAVLVLMLVTAISGPILTERYGISLGQTAGDPGEPRTTSTSPESESIV